MKTLSTVLLSSGICLISTVAFAQDAMKTPDGMAKEGMMNSGAMTMQQCKDQMAMPKNGGIKKDDAAMKRDTMCAGMMKKEGLMRPAPAMMKKEGLMRPDPAAMKNEGPMKKEGLMRPAQATMTKEGLMRPDPAAMNKEDPMKK